MSNKPDYTMYLINGQRIDGRFPVGIKGDSFSGKLDNFATYLEDKMEFLFITLGNNIVNINHIVRVAPFTGYEMGHKNS